MTSAFFLPERPRLAVFVGPYGTGKSEIAVNFALALRASGANPVLCDLDIINPFVRSVDARAFLERQGIRVIASEYANTNVDVPAVPASVFSVFDRSEPGVLDIGGEDLGARVLGSLAERFRLHTPKIWLVVNPYRPFSARPEQIAEAAAAIGRAARLPIDGLIHNGNLMDLESSEDALVESWPVTHSAAIMIGRPVVFTTWRIQTGVAPPVRLFPDQIPVLPIQPFLSPRDRLDGCNHEP